MGYDYYNLDTMQDEVSKWAMHNFGPLTPSDSILGIGEEVAELFEAHEFLTNALHKMVQANGQLNHAHLKAKQGIRGDLDEHEAKGKDALADMIIFALNYAAGMKWKLWPILQTVWMEVRKRDFKKYPDTGMSPQEKTNG